MRFTTTLIALGALLPFAAAAPSLIISRVDGHLLNPAGHAKVQSRNLVADGANAIDKRFDYSLIDMDAYISLLKPVFHFVDGEFVDGSGTLVAIDLLVFIVDHYYSYPGFVDSHGIPFDIKLFAALLNHRYTADNLAILDIFVHVLNGHYVSIDGDSFENTATHSILSLDAVLLILSGQDPLPL